MSQAAAKPSAFVLLGPTASGKSQLAMQLAAQHPVETVSLDSAQVYRDMDIGTAKPSAAERQGHAAGAARNDISTRRTRMAAPVTFSRWSGILRAQRDGEPVQSKYSAEVEMPLDRVFAFLSIKGFRPRRLVGAGEHVASGRLTCRGRRRILSVFP